MKRYHSSLPHRDLEFGGCFESLRRPCHQVPARDLCPILLQIADYPTFDVKPVHTARKTTLPSLPDICDGAVGVHRPESPPHGFAQKHGNLGTGRHIELIDIRLSRFSFRGLKPEILFALSQSELMWALPLQGQIGPDFIKRCDSRSFNIRRVGCDAVRTGLKLETGR